MAILGCEPLFRHKGPKIALAAIPVRSLIITWLLHLKMWMMLSGGGG